MKNYDEFKEEFRDKVGELIEAQGVRIESESFEKVNQSRDGFVVKYDDLPIAPIIYTDSLYEEYQNGRSINELAFKTVITLNDSKEQVNELIHGANEFIKDNMYAAVVNTDMNKEMLEHIPHKEIEDLSVIPRYKVSDQASYIINNEQARLFNMTPEEVLDTACWNSISDGYNIAKMSDMLNEMVSENIVENDIPMYVITNDRGIDGASAVIDKRWMKELAAEVNDNLIIIPSSRHELIAIPESTTDVEDIKEMVKEVNSSVVSQRDILSDSVYVYDSERDILRMASGELNREVIFDNNELNERDVHLAAER